jgi:hypothetical protein
MSQYDEFDGDGRPGRREPVLGRDRGDFAEGEAYAEAPIPQNREAPVYRRGHVPPDDYGRGLRPGAGRRRLLVGMAAGAALTAVLVAVVQAIVSAPGGEGEVPLIQADATPAKIRPEQPGGMTVPHQDKLVFQRLSPGGGEPTVERLLPPPEEPLPRPVAPPEPVDLAAEPTAPPAAWPEPVGAIPEPVAVPEPPAVAALPPGPPPAVAALPPGPPPAAAPAPVPLPAPPVAAPSPPAMQQAPQQGVRLQIASVRSEDVARQEFQRLQRRFPAELGDLGLTVVRADLGEKGIYYRVHAGPVDAARADAICRTLKAQSVGCLVIR